jgi:HAD superfamily hydrolase (TIGR01549 family)
VGAASSREAVAVVPGRGLRKAIGNRIRRAAGVNEITAIVFDYNGTLVDDLHLHVEAYYQAGRQLGFDVARETVQRHISQPPSAKRVLYFGSISDAAWAQLVDLRKAIYLKLADPAALLFPDTACVLSALAGRYTLGVLSNTFRHLFERLFPPQLAGLFAATLFFDEVSEPKPSPAPLRTLLERLGAAPRACIYVGDALEDVRMARAADVRAFAVATGACPAEELAVAGAEWVGAGLSALAGRLLAGVDPETP